MIFIFIIALLISTGFTLISSSNLIITLIKASPISIGIKGITNISLLCSGFILIFFVIYLKKVLIFLFEFSKNILVLFIFILLELLVILKGNKKNWYKYTWTVFPLGKDTNNKAILYPFIINEYPSTKKHCK